MQENIIPWFGEEYRIQRNFLINHKKTVIYFNGYKYRKNNFGYWIGGTTGSKKGYGCLHRAVWAYYNGEIPKKMHIHHKDGNKSNNEIENLELIDPKSHAKLHSTDEKKQMSRFYLNECREKARQWHSSKEGIEWHKEHGRKTFKDKKPINKICKQCNKEFSSVWSRAILCSPSCRTKNRILSGKDNEHRVCEFCKEKFICNKYAKKRTCSKSCAIKSAVITKSLRYRN